MGDFVHYRQKISSLFFTGLALLIPAGVFALNGSGTATNPYKITTVEELDSVRNHLSSEFQLMNDLDFAGSVYDSANSAGNAGWMPIGTSTEKFTGYFHGKGYLIRNLYINRPTMNHVGLFGFVSSAKIDSLGLVNVKIIAKDTVGGLAGRSTDTTSIVNCFSAGSISGKNFTGGLVGINFNSSKCVRCYTKGSVSGTSNVGGLIGYTTKSHAVECFSTTNVTGTTNYHGGLIGFAYSLCTIHNSYTIGNVTGGSNVGGLIGRIDAQINLSHCYSASPVTSTVAGSYGGLIGASVVSGNVIDKSYFSYDIVGAGTGGGGTGIPLEDLKKWSTTYFEQWNSDTIWTFPTGQFPWLQKNSGKPVIRTSTTSGTIPEGNSLDFRLFAYDTNGTIVTSFEVDTQTTNATITINDSIVSYTPTTSFMGIDSFSIVAVDGSGLKSIRKKFKVTVQPIYSGGSGTSADPYQITTLKQLDGIRWGGLAKHYVLMNDLDFAGSVYDSASSAANAGWQPIGNNTTRFTGSFHGKGHRIRNLFINRPTVTYIGLFGAISGLIDSVILLDCNVSGQSGVGSLVGSTALSSTIVRNCFSSGIIRGNGNVGGLIGSTSFSKTSNCAFTGSIVGRGFLSGNLGGLIGNNGGTVENCFSQAKVSSGEVYIGGLTGSNSNTITNCYSAGPVSGGDLTKTGGLSGESTDTTKVSNSFWNKDISVCKRSSGGIAATTAEMIQQTTFTNWAFDTVWIIRDGSTYPGLRSLINPPSAINVHAVTEKNTPISVTLSVFDIEDSLADSIGILNQPTHGTAVISGAVITYTPAADFAGFDTLTYFAVDNDGLTASAKLILLVKPVFTAGTGTEADPFQVSTIEQLYNIRHLPDNHFVLINDLDFAGSVYDSINPSENAGWLPIGDSLVAFSGSFNGKGHTISNLYSYFERNVGLFGYCKHAEIDSVALVNCRVRGSEHIGSLAGFITDSSRISNSHCTGSALGENSIGGLIGESSNNSVISQCYFDGSVGGVGYGLGGLAGHIISSNISNSYSTGSVANEYLPTGGSFKKPELFANGGLIGLSENSSIENGYSACSVVSRFANAGGLAGKILKSTVTNSYSVGTIRNTGFAGGLIGLKDWMDSGSVITNCFWDSVTSTLDSSMGGIGKSTDEMLSAATYTGWDFATIWGIDEGTGYPYLRFNRTQTTPVKMNNRHLPSVVSPKGSVTFYTLNGRFVKKINFSTAFSLDKMVSKAALSAGTFLAKIEMEGVKGKVRRIVKK